jgi:MoaA/NifB/PqqE/SkfB family radical SAM enzyme
MEMQLFEKIVDEVANHPECIIKLSGLGEPSLHPQIQDILSFLAKRKMMRQIRLYTNGNLFERFSPTEIIEFGVRFLIVSIDGIDAKSYEFIRVGGNYARLKANVVKLHQTREELKSRFPKIVIRHTIFPNESSKEIWQYSRDWIECADFVDFNHLEPLSPMAAGTGTPWFRHCRDIRREFYIGSGGRVPQCGNVFYAGAKKEVLSDLHNSTIQELWHNPTLQLLRSSHELGALDKVPFCKTCHSIRE